jgi:hypothetical protein
MLGLVIYDMNFCTIHGVVSEYHVTRIKQPCHIVQRGATLAVPAVDG